MARQFSVSESQICKIAGVPYEMNSIENQNRILFATTLLKHRKTYYEGMEETLSELLEPVGIECSEFEETAAGKYCVLSSDSGQEITREQMCQAIAERFNTDVEFVESWDDVNLEQVYNSLSKKKNKQFQGYFLITHDGDVACKVSSNEENVDELLVNLIESRT